MSQSSSEETLEDIRLSLGMIQDVLMELTDIQRSRMIMEAAQTMEWSRRQASDTGNIMQLCRRILDGNA